MDMLWNKVSHIKDKDFSATGVPSILKNYDMYSKNRLVCYYNKNFLHSFVHFKFDPIEDHVYDDIKILCEKSINGIYVNYVCLYSFTLNSKFLELQKKFNNFTFYYLPLITFEDVTRYIDLDFLPPIKNTYTRNYSCLMNRATQIRRTIFEHLSKNNLLDIGYVSYRNTIRAGYEDDPTNLIDKPFKNFIDERYPLQKECNISTDLWMYPQEDFIFDFGIESHDEEFVILTEKSLKGFLWGKIPVIFGCRNTMNYLEQLGYDIFRDIINYNYDIQKEKHIRIEMYLELLNYIVKIDIKKIPNLQNRLQYNRNVLINLAKRSLDSLSNINLNTEYILQNKVKFLGY